MQGKPLEKGDVTSELIKNNDTWNECMVCGKSWKDKIAIPGLLHRTVTCDSCLRRINDYQNSDKKGRKLSTL